MNNTSIYEEEGKKLISVRQFNDQLPEHIKPLQKAIPPYMPYEQGHGYLGVMLLNTKNDTVQCHLCGEWFKALSAHLKTHKVTAKEYKTDVGLYQKEPLMSLKTVSKFRTTNRYKSRRNLTRTYTYGKKPRDKEIPNGSMAIQWKNKYGTCDAQLKYRLFTAMEKYGRVPTVDEEPRLAKVMEYRYGTWTKALEQYELKPVRNYAPNGTLINPASEESIAPQCQVCLKPILRRRNRKSRGDTLIIEDKQKWLKRKCHNGECKKKYMAALYPVQSCKEENCKEKYAARGYCNKHYLINIARERGH